MKNWQGANLCTCLYTYTKILFFLLSFRCLICTGYIYKCSTFNPSIILKIKSNIQNNNDNNNGILLFLVVFRLCCVTGKGKTAVAKLVIEPVTFPILAVHSTNWTTQPYIKPCPLRSSFPFFFFYFNYFGNYQPLPSWMSPLM